MNTHIAAASVRQTSHTGSAADRIPVDAVGRPVAVDDAVTAMVGNRGVLAVVERISGSRLVVRRRDGMKAVLNSGNVVVVQHVRRDAGTDVAS